MGNLHMQMEAQKIVWTCGMQCRELNTAAGPLTCMPPAPRPAQHAGHPQREAQSG